PCTYYTAETALFLDITWPFFVQWTLIIGSKNAVTYKEIFPLIKEDKLWLGYGFRKDDAYFRIPLERAMGYAPGVYNPATGLVHFRNCTWYTNLDIQKRHEELTLFKRYYGNEEEYPHYANYDAIEVSKVSDIPCDYYEEIGVPITYLDKHNPDQFEIIGASRWLGKPMSEIAPKGSYVSGGVRFYLPVESSQNVHVERERERERERDSSSAVSTTEWSSSAAGYRRLYDRIVIKRKVQRCHGRSHHLFG
ncbi:adenine-specific methyltransferase EcoRI family protein, partial [Intestinimonas butyriciproducens]